jgi:hydrogenase maturation protein HypF
MQTWHLHITGQVQGVGFRPFIYRLAVARGLRGWVNNTLDGVHVSFNATPAAAASFRAAILSELPAIARLTHIELRSVSSVDFPDFRIIHSEGEGIASLLLSPDFGICPDCRAEVLSANDRRTDYAFTTCTYCGPRLSIIKGLPYDRPLTAMDSFKMCPHCQSEYDEPTDRRYYAQTNSCPACAITLCLYDQSGRKLAGSQSELLDQVVDFWRAGKIVALKGIGGYLLTCAADNPAVIQTLRARKHRPMKPLAIMYPSAAALGEAVALAEEVSNMLVGPVAPIAIIPVTAAMEQLALTDLAPGLRKLGVMLPYTPLYTLLLARYGKAIVATSGNRSGQPIIFSNESALADLSPLADYVLANDRAVVVPQDDSVMQWTAAGQKIVLRRSRGLAPTLLTPYAWQGDELLAAGADLKSSFALLHQRQAYVSPYWGDLSDWATQENYRTMLRHFSETLQAEPQLVLVDAHPQYASTILGQEIAAQRGVAIERIPHHEAHFAAILGEHALTEVEDPVLGVVWDGTGWGGDGQIWGGELFDYRAGTIRHIGQVDYFPNSLGDKLAREPRLCAWSLLAVAGLSAASIQLQFTETEYNFYQQHFRRPPKLLTSSVGRLFDGVAALLDLKATQSHEAEAAMLLEAKAQEWVTQHGQRSLHDYLSETKADNKLATASLVRALVRDIAAGSPTGAIAANFHYTLVQWIARVARHGGYRRIACSGGVFQNALLVDMCIQELRDDFQLYLHERLSPNDENIAFGQLVWYDLQQSRRASSYSIELASTTA